MSPEMKSSTIGRATEIGERPVCISTWEGDGEMDFRNCTVWYRNGLPCYCYTARQNAALATGCLNTRLSPSTTHHFAAVC